MSDDDAGWDLEKCRANEKVEIDVDDDPINTIASLKLEQNLSSIALLLPGLRCPFEHRHEKAIDGISELLTANTNIRNLKLENEEHYKAPPIGEHVLEALANGKAGDSLEYLWYDFNELSTGDADALQRYAKTCRNLRRLRIHVGEGQASLQLLSCLSGIRITELCLDVCPYRGMGELGAAIGQCSSVLSLKIVVKREELFADVQWPSFFRGTSELRFLTRLEIDLSERYFSAEVIDSIESLAVQQGNLAHFGVLTSHQPEGCIESWKGLGLALCSVKSVRLRIHPQEAVLVVLAHLQSCETLELSTSFYSQTFPRMEEVATGLSNLRIVSIGDNHAPHDNALTMIKSINSITTVRLNRGSAAFRDSIESFCILNRVFSTNLVTFGPTDLWTRVLAKVSATSARATLIYRLLCEKPELCMQSVNGYSSEEHQG